MTRNPDTGTAAANDEERSPVSRIEPAADLYRSGQALRESEERYRILADTLPVQIWTARPDGSLDYVSPPSVAYFGIPESRLLGEGWQGVLHPTDLTAAGQRWKHSLATGEPYEIEFRLLRGKDQRYRWHTARARALRGPDGTIIKWIGSNSDIDDQKRAMEVRDAALAQAKAERERLMQVFMKAPAVMALYRGPDHVVSMVNPMWEMFVGRRNAIGKRIRDLFPEVESQEVFDILDRVRSSGEAFSASELRVLFDRKSDGVLEETWWNVVFQPLADANSPVADILMHAVEVTREVLLRRELELERGS